MSVAQATLLILGYYLGGIRGAIAAGLLLTLAIAGAEVGRDRKGRS